MLQFLLLALELLVTGVLHRLLGFLLVATVLELGREHRGLLDHLADLI